MSDFVSTHKLDFECAPWQRGENFLRFRVGTCEGLWLSTDESYGIVAVINSEPNNGHFTDVLEWFENSAKRDGKSLQILEVFNRKLKKHLIEKRGFKKIKGNNVEKTF